MRNSTLGRVDKQEEIRYNIENTKAEVAKPISTATDPAIAVTGKGALPKVGAAAKQRLPGPGQKMSGTVICSRWGADLGKT